MRPAPVEIIHGVIALALIAAYLVVTLAGEDGTALLGVIAGYTGAAGVGSLARSTGAAR